MLGLECSTVGYAAETLSQTEEDYRSLLSGSELLGKPMSEVLE